MSNIDGTPWFNPVKRYWEIGFNVLSIGNQQKNPNISDWEKWKTQRQKWREVAEMNWQYATGLAAIAGQVSSDLVCVDFDDQPDNRALVAMISKLRLSFFYDWQVQSGSGKGYHLWLRCQKLDLEGKGKIDSPGVYGGHVEIRYTGHIALLPPSLHKTGNLYKFIHGQPADLPALVSMSDLVSAYKEITIKNVPEEVKPAPKPAKSPKPTTLNTPPSAKDDYHPSRKKAFLEAAIRDEQDILNSAPKGDGNDTLYASAKSLGQYVKAGWLTYARFEAILLGSDAGKRRPEQEAIGTIRSGYNKANPTVTIPDEKVKREPTRNNGSGKSKALNPPNMGRGRDSGDSSDPSPVPTGDDPLLNLTDLGNAERLIQQQGQDLLYCQAWKSWLVWDGTRWKKDDSGEVERRAKLTVRAIPGEMEAVVSYKLKEEIAKHAIRSEAAQRIEAMIRLARFDSSVVVKPDEFDADAYLLNCQNGVIDLRTGQIMEHQRDHRHLKQAQAIHDPAATAPTWEAFLNKIMGGNPNLIGFIQRAVGYSLLGSAEKQVAFFLHGKGSNGKSTFLELLRFLLGDYALNTPTSTLMRKKDSSGINNDVARLMGARLVTAIETDENQHLSEATIKSLTGNDTITARYLYAENFDFKPVCKIWLACNHKPIITGTDIGIWRRIRLIPFTVTIPDSEKDPYLSLKLQAELSGILNWALEGCLQFLEQGLGEPAEVMEAGNKYRTEMDSIATFIEDCCIKHDSAVASANALYMAYQKYTTENGDFPVAPKKFGVQLADMGFVSHRGTNGTRIWRKIGLASDASDS